EGRTGAGARRRETEVGEGGQPARERVAAPQEETADDAAVNGEATLPHREDFSREAEVVVEVEGDVIQSRTDEPAEQAKLRGLEHAIGIEPAATRLVIGKPEPDSHRARHEDAVPAEAQGTQLKSDRARRVKHAGSLIRPGFRAVKQIAHFWPNSLTLLATLRYHQSCPCVPLSAETKEPRLPPPSAMPSVLDPILQAGPMARFVLGVL